LYITNVPIYYEAAHLLIAETFLAADNGLLQPGQTADLGVQLQNTGNLAATEVTAILSSTDEFVTMVNSTSEYFDLLPETSGVNRDPFSFTIAETAHQIM
jgi:adenine deaminase